ncbi:MAG TPA: type II toxin-antitoxin system prevent-host-death family antitoxin [Verrucomicrobiae bacterium]|nr:type II toxin-antitoxin system prevent-host-death family antitoxin [Verrucomicrobiae bacterium]
MPGSRTVGADEAKTHFSALLSEVESGETITVTRNGEPVARLVPVEGRRERIRRLLEETKDLRERIGGQFTTAEIKEWVNEGRR